MGTLINSLMGVVWCCATVGASQPTVRPMPPFDQVDYVTCRNPSRFAALWQSGHQQTIRMAILGDSQETCPGGGGKVYVPRLAYEFWKRYGNVPETQFNGAITYGNENDAGWLVRSNVGGPNPVEGRYSLKKLPPGIGLMRSHCSTNGLINLTGEFYGQLDMVLPGAEGLPLECQIPAGPHFFDIDGQIAAEIFAATNVSSGEVRFRARPQSSMLSSYFGPISTQGVLVMGLESPVSEVKSARTPPLDCAGKPFLSVEISGDRDDKLTDILGMRLINLSNPAGVAITSLSTGGYHTTDFLNHHGQCGPLFAALDFNVAMICYGANDVTHDSTPQRFRDDLIALIAWVRQTTGDPNFPFVLVADCDREGITPAMRVCYDGYPAAMRAIALADPNVMAVNARRMMHERGWRVGSEQFWTYVPDGVHESPFAAIVLAREVVDAMLTGPSWRPRITLTPQLPPP